MFKVNINHSRSKIVRVKTSRKISRAKIKLLAFIIITLMLFPAASLLSADTENKKTGPDSLSKNNTVKATTNIHYTGTYCDQCHEKKPVKGGKIFLKFGGDYQQLCRCHPDTPGAYIHPFDIKPAKERKKDTCRFSLGKR